MYGQRRLPIAHNSGAWIFSGTYHSSTPAAHGNPRNNEGIDQFVIPSVILCTWLLTRNCSVLKDCREPYTAFCFVSSLAAAWYSGGSPSQSGHAHLLLCTFLKNDSTFPMLFADLLTTPAMAPYIEPIVGLLCGLLDVSEANQNCPQWQRIQFLVRQDC